MKLQKINNISEHALILEKERSDSVTTLYVYKSDGFDGYSAGSWGAVIQVGGWYNASNTFFSCGWPSADLATESAISMLAEYRN